MIVWLNSRDLGMIFKILQFAGICCSSNCIYSYRICDHSSFPNVVISAMLEKHYCTIHLPIKDSHHSFSSLLYLNPEAFKGNYVVCFFFKEL